jgi:hypothetical protein
MSSVALCNRPLDPRQDGRPGGAGNAERRALFVGLWPPTLYLMGDSLERLEQPRRRLLR